ncbi:hypothetical protein PpBr36_03965 [Pyricularia pennisetigena]|uniref:hypothetical protein n=1 Tax=Pyricularia pennisetigena TaxID=1578925 RepID=UPI00114DC366|nr:hypothetical protein PpBr36_03965 [Pyricularia pennisetigena]TLS29881.1 hypothetical protein PpBr36_03965 [Pyricularia pennisetigena]
MSAVHQAPDIRAACSGSRTDEFLMPDATGGTIEHMDLSNIFSQRAMDALEASLAPAPELLPPPYNQYFGPSSPDQQQQEQQPKYSAKRPKASVAALPTPFDTPSYGSFSHSSSEGSRLSDLEVGGRQADAGSSDNDSETDCTSCVEKMLEAFERVHLETAQRKVLWRSSTPQDGGQRDSLAMDSRLLYYQKVLMSTGETMLGCSHCMSRSVALILIASLGDAVLDTIDLMLGMTEGKEGDEERARRDCHQGRDQQRLRDTIALMGDRGGGYDGLREDRSDSGAEGTGGSGLDCFLDQKDRQVVIKALLGCRLVQLHTLLGQIDRMIHNQARTAQKAILRNTLARLQTYSSMYSVG